MYPSLRSLKNFFYINGILLSLGSLEYYLYSLLSSYWMIHRIYYFLGLLFLFTMRNYGLIYLIDNGTSNKISIANNSSSSVQEKYPFEFHISLVTTTSIETVTYMYISSFIIFNEGLSQSILCDLVLFIPISFLFEIVFDFFHYSGHRFLHSPWIYRYFHKVHHRFLHPISITTFYQDPFDLMITNSIPIILAVSIIPRISYLMFHWLLIYKNFIEISGHCGKISYPSSSFPQFVWLPLVLGIELYMEDHDIHHSMNNCNYSKRFSLWDKVFGTYKPFHNQVFHSKKSQ